ncbi:MAG TPA: hypothetical protein VGC51_10605 [Hansschlegelia sp.]
MRPRGEAAQIGPRLRSAGQREGGESADQQKRRQLDRAQDDGGENERQPRTIIPGRDAPGGSEAGGGPAKRGHLIIVEGACEGRHIEEDHAGKQGDKAEDSELHPDAEAAERHEGADRQGERKRAHPRQIGPQRRRRFVDWERQPVKQRRMVDEVGARQRRSGAIVERHGGEIRPPTISVREMDDVGEVALLVCAPKGERDFREDEDAKDRHRRDEQRGRRELPFVDVPSEDAHGHGHAPRPLSLHAAARA